ncbi:MAG: hypothetical protein RMK80_09795, partial [Pseudobdellovibrionaceae bacterium]|nr:hypothetical protein [Pseudobdellovibrionaceae bacterium]
SDKIWLIKSSGRLLGPVTLTEVMILLQKRFITVIDEIRSPTQRWMFIRDHQSIMMALKQLSDDNLSEKTSDVTSGQDNTKTKTEATTTNELLSEPEKFLDYIRNPDSFETVESSAGISSLKTVPPTKSVRATTTPPPTTKVYGVSGDVRLEEKYHSRARTARWLILAAVAVLIGVFWGIQWFENKKREEQNAKRIQALRKAQVHFNRGEYEEATRIYDEIYSKSKSLFSASDFLNYVILLIAYHDTRLAQAVDVFEGIGKPENFPDWKKWMLLKLQFSFKKEAWDEAILLTRELIQSSPEEFELSLILAQIHYWRKQYHDSIQVLDQLLQRGEILSRFLQEQAYFLYGLNLLKMPSEDRVSYVDRFLKFVAPLKTFRFYYLQLKILQALLTARATNIHYRIILNDVWSVNIFEHAHLAYDLFIPSRVYSFEHFLPVCEKFSEALTGVKVSSEERPLFFDSAVAIYSICQFYGNNKSMAFTNLELARKQRPKNEILLATAAQLLARDERLAEVPALLNLCESGFPCQLAKLFYYYKKENDVYVSELISSLESPQVGPLYFLVKADLAKKRGNDMTYQVEINEGLKHYNQYLPLIRRKL